jgi:hypothetical protein
MKRLIHSLKNFGKYPSKLTPLSDFFRFDSKESKYEFCPHGKKCEFLEPGILKQGEEPQVRCDECMQDYLKNSNLDESTQKFLYDRLHPGSKKDNHWIVINETFDEKEQ